VKFLIILPNLCGGGAERLHINLAKDWIKQGHTVEFFLMKKQGALLSILPKDVRVSSPEVERIRSFILPIRKYLISSKPDIVLSAMWPLTSITVVAWILSGKQGKLFLSEHVILTASIVNELFLPYWLVSLSLKTTYPFATGIIAVSQSVKNDLCVLGGVSCSYFKVINNPAALGAVPLGKEYNHEVWDKKFDNHILSVGTLKFEKNYKSLIIAFSHMAEEFNAKLVILGDGDQRLELEELVLELGMQSRVSLPGFVLDPYPWYKGADLFVLSSLWEGFGNVIVEALENGVPVVSTDSGGPSEILDGGLYGKLTPVDDHNLLTAAMIESLKEVHNNSYLVNRSQDFLLSKISAEYLNYFRVMTT
jgi:glycosyltransferase involved in cell wall biosynthesis